MIESISRIIVLLNSFEMADTLLEKAFSLARQQDAVLEVLYVHEESLFDLPDYFRGEEDIGDDVVDKEKIKKEIKERLSKLGSCEECAILVYVDDTVSRVLSQIKVSNQTLIVTAYDEKLTEKLVKKSHTSFLVIKNDKKFYDSIVMPVDLSENSHRCITVAKTLFSQSKIKLLYDNHYVMLKELKEKKKSLFEDLKKETKLEGDYLEECVVSEVGFVDELYAIEKHLAAFVNTHDFDLTVLYTHEVDTLFSSSISFAMLEMIQTDLLLLRSLDS